MKKFAIVSIWLVLSLSCLFSVALAKRDMEDMSRSNPKEQQNVWLKQVGRAVTFFFLVTGILVAAYFVGGSVINWWSGRR